MQLLTAELRRSGLLAIRHPAHFVVGNAVLILLFLGFSGGLRAAAMMGTEATSSDLALVYLCWTLLANGFLFTSGELTKDIQEGAIQRIVLSGHRLGAVVAIRSLIGIGHSLLVGGVMLAGLIAVGGTDIALSPTLFAGMLACAVTGAGLGLAAAGVTLAVQSSMAILAPLQFVLLVVLTAVVLSSGGVAVQLAAPGGPVLAALVREHANAGDWGLAVCNGVAYLVAGWACFRWLEGRARRFGTIGR